MIRKNMITYIILWFIAILLWFLFCFWEVKDAYYNGENTQESFDIMNVQSNDTISQKQIKQEASKESNESQEQTPKEENVPYSDLEDKTNQNSLSDCQIRVLLLSDEERIFHDKVVLKYKEELLEIDTQSKYFQKTDKIRIRIWNQNNSVIQIMSLHKKYGNPHYEGTIEIQKKDEGLVVINELSLESYIKGVLPGEMSSSFPMEALKAQAVCARTFAVMKMNQPAYPLYGAAVDDSVSSQVYMMQQRNEKADLAVEETENELLYDMDGQLTHCYYYSTSCGKHATEEVWDIDAINNKQCNTSDETEQEFEDFICTRNESHLEKEEPFYRWTYETKISSEALYERCQKRNLCTDDFGNIKDIKIVCRENGGAAELIEIICEDGTFTIAGEYNIRYVLSNGGNAVLQNESEYAVSELLPSAFLTITCKTNKKGNIIGYTIHGGGFGHGIGMSQNGAKYMAKAGNNYVEILQTYYRGSYIDKSEIK